MEADKLQERVEKFSALELPGQPPVMHMGTSYLVNDLWREVQRLRSLAGAITPGPSAAETLAPLRHKAPDTN